MPDELHAWRMLYNHHARLQPCMSSIFFCEPHLATITWLCCIDVVRLVVVIIVVVVVVIIVDVQFSLLRSFVRSSVRSFVAVTTLHCGSVRLTADYGRCDCAADSATRAERATRTFRTFIIVVMHCIEFVR